MNTRERPGLAAPVRCGLQSAGGLALSALLAVLLMGCANAPPQDTGAATPAPQSIAPPAAGPDVANTASAANTNQATLTPAERQARAKQAAVQADQAAQQALQQQCSDLRTEIREQQLDEQQAPNTSVSEQIVQAKEAHADQRIQDLQDRFDSLDCTAVTGPRSHTPVVPVPPVPNGLSPPGNQGLP